MSKFKKMAKQFYNNWYLDDPQKIITGTRTGFRDLDPVTGGLRPGELVMVASRPAVGKTSLALNMVDNISIRNNGRSLYLTNDCSEKIIADRLIQIHAGVSGICFRRFEFYDEEEMALEAEKNSLTNAKVEIKNITGISVYALEDVVKESCLKHSLKLLVIDDFKTLKEADNSDDEDIFRELKRIAENYDVPVIILCPVSQATDCRVDHHPTMADIDIKGGITISDFVFFLYRENYYEPTEETTVPLEIDIVKNPRGRRGTVVLKTYKDCFSMADYPGDKLLDMRKKYEGNHFCHIFDRWEEVIASLEFSGLNEGDYNIYVRPLELQTVGGKPVTLTVIIPEGMDEKLYEDNYKDMLIEAVAKVTELNCEDIYFVMQSEMEEFYKKCEKDEKRWS